MLCYRGHVFKCYLVALPGLLLFAVFAISGTYLQIGRHYVNVLSEIKHVVMCDVMLLHHTRYIAFAFAHNAMISDKYHKVLATLMNP